MLNGGKTAQFIIVNFIKIMSSGNTQEIPFGSDQSWQQFESGQFQETTLDQAMSSQQETMEKLRKEITAQLRDELKKENAEMKAKMVEMEAEMTEMKNEISNLKEKNEWLLIRLPEQYKKDYEDKFGSESKSTQKQEKVEGAMLLGGKPNIGAKLHVVEQEHGKLGRMIPEEIQERSYMADQSEEIQPNIIQSNLQSNHQSSDPSHISEDIQEASSSQNKNSNKSN